MATRHRLNTSIRFTLTIHTYAYSCFYAYSLSCIFITMHIHYYAYSSSWIFITMHIHLHTYSYLYTYSHLYACSHHDNALSYISYYPSYSRDGHRQIHTAIRLHRYAYRRYYRTEWWLYVTTDCLVDSTINSVNVNSFVVVISHIAKQHFTRLHCDSSK